ncbi:MAG: hypothetical protein ACYCPW_02215 [Nitrososphaerales archaeon]
MTLRVHRPTHSNSKSNEAFFSKSLKKKMQIQKSKQNSLQTSHKWLSRAINLPEIGKHTLECTKCGKSLIVNWKDHQRLEKASINNEDWDYILGVTTTQPASWNTPCEPAQEQDKQWERACEITHANATQTDEADYRRMIGDTCKNGECD